MSGFQYGVKSIWKTHPKSVDMLRESIDLRMSASETAKKLAAEFGMPVTANMCVSKARGLKIRFNSQAIQNTFDKHGSGKARASRAVAVRSAPKPIKIAIAAPEKPVDAPRGRGLPLLALTRRNECRWPTGVDEEGRHLFCAEEVSDATLENSRCYCPGHSAVAYRGAPTRTISPEQRRAMVAGKAKSKRQEAAIWLG